jgi:4-amino-4-deoxy-L-arabinose transferase-like glycosyltransferase
MLSNSRLFDTGTDKTRGYFSQSSIKWFSLYAIGLLTCIWSFVLDWSLVQSWIPLSIFIVVLVANVIPILFFVSFNGRHKTTNKLPRIYPYLNVLLYVGLAILAALTGWFGGVLMSKFIEFVALETFML